jgi:hypothetical protein
MHEIGDDEADGVRAARDQRTGGKVGLEVEVAHALEDALAGFLADIGVVAQDLRYGDDGDAEETPRSRAMSFIRTGMVQSTSHGRLICWAIP